MFKSELRRNSRSRAIRSKSDTIFFSSRVSVLALSFRKLVEEEREMGEEEKRERGEDKYGNKGKDSLLQKKRLPVNRY